MIDFSNVKSIVIPEGEVSIIAHGAEILWQKRKYKRELAYLESTGTQHIDLKYVPNNTTELEIVVSGISPDSFSSSSGTWFFGARAGYLNRAFGSYYDPTANLFYYAFGNVMPNGSYTTLYEGTKTIKVDATGLYVDGARIITLSPSAFTAPVPLALFGLNNNGTIISRTSYNAHLCRVRDSGTFVRDCIPVLDWNDRPCMYDKVTDELFYNQGTGEFAYASQIKPISELEV